MGKTTVYLPDELLNTLEKKTQEDDLKKSQLVQRALKQYFQTEPDETDSVTIKQEQLEEKIETIEKTQDALLEKLGLHVKKPKEVKEEEEKIVLMEESEEIEEEEY